MAKTTRITTIGSLLGLAMFPVAAQAGGWDKNEPGAGLDLLFDPGKVVVDGTILVQDISRVYDSYTGYFGTTSTGSGGDLDIGTTGVRGTAALKFDFLNNHSCMLGYREPYNLYTDFGDSWSGRYKFTEKKGDVYEASVTCSYKAQLGPGYLRAIVGGSYDWGSFSFTQYAGGSNYVTTSLDAEGAFGWRVGAAYEIPEYAMRASLMYYSGIKLDADGAQTLQSGTTLGHASATLNLPQAVELSVQSGIAPDWLAYGSIKWTDWSVVGDIPISSTNSSLSGTLLLSYRDGWTVTGGIGHKFTDNWSGTVGLIWDRGVSTGYDEYANTYTMLVGAKFTTDDKKADLTASLGITEISPVDIAYPQVTGKGSYTASAGWDTAITGRLGVRIRLQ
jgi:long-chain fatty acid transport protein